MSGHSKWSTIKRQKGKSDAQRAKLFTKIGREIAVAVKAGGMDPSTNPKLRDLIAKAKSNNMPGENITRSIKKAGGELNSINYEAITYEGYGPGGIAVIVEALTDNKNRTAADVRHIFDKAGGSMGTTGCVSYMFDTKGVIEIDTNLTEDEIMIFAIECGAEDFICTDGFAKILTAANNLDAVRSELEKSNITILSYEINKLPATTVNVDDESAPKVIKMLDSFEDNDDIQQIYHNAILPHDDLDEK